MDDSTTVIKPTIAVGKLYKGEKRELNETPAGTYRMALTNSIRVKKSKAGNAQLEAFFKHTENNGYAGINFRVLLEGTNKNGEENSKQFGELLRAIGVTDEELEAGPEVVLRGSLASIPAEEQWKGVPAAIAINGIVREDLIGREASVVVKATTYNGKVEFKATGIYPIKAAS